MVSSKQFQLKIAVGKFLFIFKFVIHGNRINILSQNSKHQLSVSEDLNIFFSIEEILNCLKLLKFYIGKSEMVMRLIDRLHSRKIS